MRGTFGCGSGGLGCTDVSGPFFKFSVPLIENLRSEDAGGGMGGTFGCGLGSLGDTDVSGAFCKFTVPLVDSLRSEDGGARSEPAWEARMSASPFVSFGFP